MTPKDAAEPPAKTAKGKVASDKAKTAEKSKPTVGQRDDWPQVKSSARVGDVEILAIGARNVDIAGTRFGEFVNLGRMLMIQLRFSNTSKAKRVKFGGWQNDRDAKVTDEHANAYDFISFGNGFAFSGEGVACFGDPELCAGCNTNPITAGSADFDPGARYLRHLFVDKSVDVAREVRLTLPAKELGGEGMVYLRVPILR